MTVKKRQWRKSNPFLRQFSVDGAADRKLESAVLGPCSKKTQRAVQSELRAEDAFHVVMDEEGMLWMSSLQWMKASTNVC